MTNAARQRTNMVESQVMTSDVTDRRILLAMGDLPRERFVPEALVPLAYMDEAVPPGAELIQDDTKVPEEDGDLDEDYGEWDTACKKPSEEEAAAARQHLDGHRRQAQRTSWRGPW